MSKTYDAMVIGVGGVGSAALYHLARRGIRVLGLDRFPPGHDQGSSHGETRIIRQAYFEHVDYVPLLLRAYQLWEELEQATAQKLFHQVGLLQVGPAEGAVIAGVMASAEQHRLPVERLSAQEIHSRFPGFFVPENCVGAFEPKAGFLRVEACVQAHAREAVRAGAELITNEAVLSWSACGTGFQVLTNQQTYHCERLIISPGPWAAALLSDLRFPFEVRRKHLYWYTPQTGFYAADKHSPTFLYDLPHGVFYGFPAIDAQGVKVAEHSGGVVVKDPLTDSRAFDPADCQRVRDFLDHHLPQVLTQRNRHGECYYTMTPDEHFIVDQHPQQANLAFVAGLSGHGFKFTSVLGEILADLAISGATPHPVSFLSAHRPALHAR
jgi:sarcosine oxidase